MKTLSLPIALLVLSQPLSAVTVFTDRMAWEDALSTTIITETFDVDIAEGPNTITFAGGVESTGVSLIDGTGDNTVSGGEWSGNVRNSTTTNTGYTSITWTFPQEISAFGADFNSIAGSRALEIVANWDGMGETGINLRDTIGSGGFLGVIGDATFTEIRFDINEATASIAGNDVFRADNASYTNAVPEPSATLLFGCAALSLGLRRKRI